MLLIFQSVGDLLGFIKYENDGASGWWGHRGYSQNLIRKEVPGSLESGRGNSYPLYSQTGAVTTSKLDDRRVL
jgi:hypothetical protein